MPLPEGVSVPEDGLIEIEVGKKDLTNWFDSSEKVENGYSKFIRHIDVEHLSWPTHTGHRTTPVCKPKGRSWEKSRTDRKK